MRKLFVWMRLADGTVRLAGELATTEPLANSGRLPWYTTPKANG